MGDTFGKLFRVTTWGESHGPAVGVVVEGCPPLLDLGFQTQELEVHSFGQSTKLLAVTSPEIQAELDRRKPGQSSLTTPRKEADRAVILSGVFEGKTTGTPIMALSWNGDVLSGDYASFRNVDRPSHAGFTYRNKYGIVDPRGGGRASYRETWGRVFAGTLAKKYLSQNFGIEILACVSQVGSVKANVDLGSVTLEQIESNPVRCPESVAAQQMAALIESARKDGDSLGGTITAVARHVPIGLGEPVFDKLDADLFKAIKSIHATKAIEIGRGFDVANMHGSEHNDVFTSDSEGHIRPKTNHAGGVLGGISSGEDIVLRIAFKPTATIRKSQETVTVAGEKTTLVGVGRHDPCVLPRAVVTVESMIALTLMDHAMRNQAQCGSI